MQAGMIHELIFQYNFDLKTNDVLTALQLSNWRKSAFYSVRGKYVHVRRCSLHSFEKWNQFRMPGMKRQNKLPFKATSTKSNQYTLQIIKRNYAFKHLICTFSRSFANSKGANKTVLIKCLKSQVQGGQLKSASRKFINVSKLIAWNLRECIRWHP